MSTTQQPESLVPCLYQVGRTLGSGGFGRVNECKHIDNGMYFAVKIYRAEMLEREGALIHHELQIMGAMRNLEGCFVKIVDLFYAERELYIVMDMAMFGDMWAWINQHNYMTERAMFRVIHQLLQALVVCHDNHIVHRDVKLENIVIEDILQTEEPGRILLCDFGLATFITPGSVLSGEPGTLGYQAPELFRESGHGSYGFGVDIWAVGVCAYFLVMGKLPFEVDSDIGQYLQDCEVFPEMHTSDAVETFIRRCLTVDPAQRWTARQALQFHAFAGLPNYGNSTEAMEYRRRCDLMRAMWGRTSALPESMAVDEGDDDDEEMGSECSSSFSMEE